MFATWWRVLWTTGTATLWHNTGSSPELLSPLHLLWAPVARHGPFYSSQAARRLPLPFHQPWMPLPRMPPLQPAHHTSKAISWAATVHWWQRGAAVPIACLHQALSCSSSPRLQAEQQRARLPGDAHVTGFNMSTWRNVFVCPQMLAPHFEILICASGYNILPWGFKKLEHILWLLDR